ncbi:MULTISPECIES: GIY-YIG nuclease family protein [Clostridium]|uniref:GIY-YIG nuclease family protein n=1 Tax=Clostridium TaxID=1485 RepID=UPI000CF8D921|nr:MULTISPECIES: GIY-YIG nuclease family protein [Clostridium]PSM59013.1 hypothetical protein C4L39_03910 [Clostridium diolis]
MCKKIVGIYLFKNNVTKRVRIGSSKDCMRRKSNYLANLRNGRDDRVNKLMLEDFVNYGEQSFEFIILEECKVHDLFIRERYYLEEIYDDVAFYNSNRVCKTVKDIKTGLRAKRHKENFSNIMSGENNPNCTTLNQAKANEILWLKLNTNMKYKDIAELYGCSPNLVSRIKKDRWMNSIQTRPSWYSEEVAK